MRLHLLIGTILLSFLLLACNEPTSKKEVIEIDTTKNKIVQLLPIDSVVEFEPDIKNHLLNLKLLIENQSLENSNGLFHFNKKPKEIFPPINPKFNNTIEFTGIDIDNLLGNELVVVGEINGQKFSFTYLNRNDSIIIY